MSMFSGLWEETRVPESEGLCAAIQALCTQTAHLQEVLFLWLFVLYFCWKNFHSFSWETFGVSMKGPIDCGHWQPLSVSRIIPFKLWQTKRCHFAMCHKGMWNFLVTTLKVTQYIFTTRDMATSASCDKLTALQQLVLWLQWFPMGKIVANDLHDQKMVLIQF